MTYNAKQVLMVVVATQRRMLPNDVIFRKTKMFKLKEERWMIVYLMSPLNRIHFKWSLFDASNVSPYLNTHKLATTLLH